MEYDAFLCHNSVDKPKVRIIARALERLGVRIWLDEEDMAAGGQWIRVLEQALVAAKTVVVLFGPDGPGRVQQQELDVALDECMRKNKGVIPVLLPGAPQSLIDSRPFLRLHTWVQFKDDLEEKTVIERLVRGINPDRPVAGPAPDAEPAVDIVAPPRVDPVNEVVADLAERCQSTNITFVLGKNFLDSDATSSKPTRLSRDLLSSIEMIGSDYEHLVPPLDLSAAFYATRWDESKLESHLSDLLMQPTVVPSVYAALARLLAALRDRPTRRSRMAVEQLIITTNFDTWLERALLAAGISFSRIVNFRGRRRLMVNQYRNVSITNRGLLKMDSPEGGQTTVDINNPDELQDCIREQDRKIYDAGDVGPDAESASTLSFSKLQQPIVYKLLGSYDIASSCTISADHYFDLAARAARLNSIPPKIGEIIGNSPVAFLGCGILDSDFRVSYHAFLRNAFEMKGHKRYALFERANTDQQDVAQKLGLKSWDPLRNAALSGYGIELVDSGIKAFIDRLREQIGG